MNKGKIFKFADKEEGQVLLGSWDEYLAAMSPFERSLKTGISTPVSPEAFSSFLRDCVLPWDAADMERLEPVMSRLENILPLLVTGLPDEVLLIKSTGRDEWNSAYTRANAIILPEPKIAGYTENRLAGLIAHEFFHVFSRNNPEIREKLYRLIGFMPLGNIEYPDELLGRKLTNPDAPFDRHYIEVTYGDKIIKAVPLVLLREGFQNVNSSEDILESIAARLAVLEQENGKWRVTSRAGKPLCLPMEDVSGYMEKVGENTDYIIHPEEILAENFALLVTGRENVSSPHILEEMKKLLLL